MATISVRAAVMGLSIAMIPLTGCWKAQKTAAVESIPVRVKRVELQTLKRSLDYAGNIRAREEALVYPKVSGKIMEKVREEGVRVTKGDVIAYIDRDEVGFTYEKAPVESPLAGFVGRIYVDRGTSVTLQTPIAMVVDIEAVELALDVPEKFIAQVKLGQMAELNVDAWPGETFSGQVTKISPVIDLDTRTAPVEITIKNPAYRLKPGMFARVKLVLEERNNIPVIMKEAVLGRDSDTYVYLASNNIAHLRNVRLGLREGSNYEVTEGLTPGDIVVIMGQQRLRDGAAVSTEEEPGKINPKSQNPGKKKHFDQ
ncbi:MAG: efflux RND transporter periplasmic adaptor subunit [Verrucomicrobia bacterium]|nr:efflux RND transporter periplasmic adaptor subunit [Verrucomicrobiota bacterium]